MIRYLLNFTIVLCLLNACQTQQQPPNILFIAIDDLRAELGCYGNHMIQTPNMNLIAKRGFMFNHHYVQVPTCGASRYALLTSMRPRQRGDLSNNVMAERCSTAPERENPETLVHHLRRNGYYTVGIGKISHSADGLVYGYEEKPSQVKELPYSWDEFLFDPGKWKTGWNAFFGYADGKNRQSQQGLVKPYERGMVDDQGYPDGLTTKLAVNKLTELKNQGKPFFLGVGFFKPHLPFTAPQKYWDLYDSDSISLPAFTKIPANVSRASLHDSNEFNQYRSGEERASLDTVLSDGYTRKLIHAYYACVSYIDAQVGLLMDQLQALDLESNTIVVIWGDHGWHLGDLRVWGKHTVSEYALKSSLLMRIPAKEGHGRVVDHVVESIDIFPTLLELCNIPLPGAIDGESFLKYLDPADSVVSGRAYSYFRNGISLRMDTFRLTRYFREEEPTIELYNYKADPYETMNIAAQHPEKVKELLEKLEEGNYGLFTKRE